MTKSNGDANTDDHVDCRHCPIRKRKGFRPFSEKELAFILKFKTGELTVEAGSTILLEENASPHLFTILDGWTYRHKQLEDGRRQILNFALPGDLIGLQMAILGEMEHTVTALTTTRLCVFQRDKVWEIFKGFPALSFSMTWMASREEQMVDGHLLSVGRRTAIERTAYLLLHLYDRAEKIGYAGNNAMRAPFRQDHIADALGITPVHISRTLKKLRDRELIRWNQETVFLQNRQKLEEIAQYERPDDEQRPLL